jgi:hypothetical protein
MNNNIGLDEEGKYSNSGGPLTEGRERASLGANQMSASYSGMETHLIS